LSALDLARLEAAPLHRDPFDFVLVEDFLRAETLPAVLADYPAIAKSGSFPVDGFACGPAFEALLAELTGPALRCAIGAKFGIDLERRPTIVTLRGKSDGKDGRIHTDSETKIITLLLYMNASWEAAAGRLRLLRGAHDLDDYVAEVPPLAGRMIAFRRSERSFHGHKDHVGPRRLVQLNWVTDEGVVRRELGRHRWSARLKALRPFG
jgi:hypothetical protein